MLETLTIKNIAVIDSAEIPFRSGLNIISGETGTGKSIILDAIALLLGGRASADLIRSECSEAIVEGLFDTTHLPWLKDRLHQFGFSAESDELLIKRVVSRNGKHRIYINGELATLAILQEVCDGLVDLCGQHEHQSLLKPQVQLQLLDRYGGLMAQTEGFANAFTHYRSLHKEQEMLATMEAERTQRADFLRFQINELREADLHPSEDEELQKEKQLLQSAEGRVQAAEGVRLALEGDDAGILSCLKIAAARLRTLAQLDPRAATMCEGMDRAVAEAEEVSIAINRYLDSVDLDPERLQAVQDRLSLIASLRRKYGTTVSEMIATLRRLENELGGISQIGDRLTEISEQLEKAQADLKKQATKLSGTRKKIATLLGDSVTTELKDLKMEDAELAIELIQKDDLQAWTPSGADAIQFVIRTNRGEAARPLNKIASGGELSRIMLAIRRVISDRGGIGVYLFDEIDAGIGGQTAFQVGKKLKSVAQYNQVICITHLPQVASFADHHLSVRKSSEGDRTVTTIVDLTEKLRMEELARMLGGPKLTKKSLENAAELLEMAR